MPRLFLSYRRDDTADIVGRIADRLQAQLGWESLFVDLDSIPAGADFHEYIANSVGNCHILLAIMGKNWAGPKTGRKRKIDLTNDFVRLEIENAFEHEVPVIPVLVHQAAMLAEKALPASLRLLARLQAITISSGKDFHHHVDRLIREIDSVVNTAHYDAAEAFEMRAQALGRIKAKMITKNGHLITTSDGRTYSVDEVDRRKVKTWSRRDRLDLKLKICNSTKKQEVEVTEMLTLDAQQGDLQGSWPLRFAR